MTHRQARNFKKCVFIALGRGSSNIRLDGDCSSESAGIQSDEESDSASTADAGRISGSDDDLVCQLLL